MTKLFHIIFEREIWRIIYQKRATLYLLRIKHEIARKTSIELKKDTACFCNILFKNVSDITKVI